MVEHEADICPIELVENAAKHFTQTTLAVCKPGQGGEVHPALEPTAVTQAYNNLRNKTSLCTSLVCPRKLDIQAVFYPFGVYFNTIHIV